MHDRMQFFVCPADFSLVKVDSYLCSCNHSRYADGALALPDLQRLLEALTLLRTRKVVLLLGWLAFVRRTQHILETRHSGFSNIEHFCTYIRLVGHFWGLKSPQESCSRACRWRNYKRALSVGRGAHFTSQQHCCPTGSHEF